jgi:dipeptidyl aminopeptidase/acylaminoacyl peptidase
MAKKKRITVEDLWKLERPSQPTLSPDGAQACVSVSSYDMGENKSRTKLWLLSALGGEPRPLTTVGEKDGEPRWSPDGNTIAFIAKRDKDEEPQVYLIAPDGGEARRLTSIATGAFAIKWFPDSRRIAFLSWTWRDAGAHKKLAKRYREMKDDPVKAHITEQASYRFWDHWLADGRVPRLFTVDVDSGKVRDLFAGTRYELPSNDPAAHHYDIAPDGREIAFTFNPDEARRFDQQHHIIALDLRSGRARNLTKSSPLSHASPCYAPDGRSIAFLAQDLRKSPVAPDRIALLDRATGRIRVTGTKWDRGVMAPLAWSPDFKSIVFHAEDNARVHLFRWSLGDPAPRIIGTGGTVSEFDARAGTIAFVRNSMSTPPAVFVLDSAGHERRIDRFNDAVMGKLELGAVKEFEIRGWKGEKVQMWVVYPPGFDAKKKWPLLHNIHGGPHAAWGDNFHFRWNNQVFAAQGYVVACVNYHGSSSFGQTFLESLRHEMGKRELADVEAGTDFMLKRGYIDAKRLVAAGGSYGGYMVAWMNGHTDRYKAYVCHAGCFDWVSMHADDVYYWMPRQLGAEYWDDFARIESQNPRANVKGMKTPTLVIHGLLDYRVPDAQGLAYYNALKAKGVPARLLFFPDENHWILKPRNSRLWYREFFAWLARFVATGGKRRG